MVVTVWRRADGIDRVLWAAAILCVVATLWLSLVEVPPGTSAFGGADKVEHAFAYFVTALLILLAAVWRPGRGEGVLWPWRWWVLGAMVLAGGAVEIVQSYVGREAELADWVAEIVAVVLAAGALGLWRRASASSRGEAR
jgi:predicted anti-sigma-YlaC factor YlaD